MVTWRGEGAESSRVNQDCLDQALFSTEYFSPGQSPHYKGSSVPFLSSAGSVVEFARMRSFHDQVPWVPVAFFHIFD